MSPSSMACSPFSRHSAAGHHWGRPAPITFAWQMRRKRLAQGRGDDQAAARQAVVACDGHPTFSCRNCESMVHVRFPAFIVSQARREHGFTGMIKASLSWPDPDPAGRSDRGSRHCRAQNSLDQITVGPAHLEVHPCGCFYKLKI
jgi:hypothetical protein